MVQTSFCHIDGAEKIAYVDVSAYKWWIDDRQQNNYLYGAVRVNCNKNSKAICE